MSRRDMGSRELGKSRTRQASWAPLAGRRALGMPHVNGIVDVQTEARFQKCSTLPLNLIKGLKSGELFIPSHFRPDCSNEEPYSLAGVVGIDSYALERARTQDRFLWSHNCSLPEAIRTRHVKIRDIIR